MSRSYTSIPLSLAQFYLGLPEDRLIADATREGWQFSDGVFIPKLAAEASTTQQTSGTFAHTRNARQLTVSSAAHLSTISSFDQVVKAAAHLESFAA